jgi:hypothetical protein
LFQPTRYRRTFPVASKFTIEDEMNKLIVGLIAAAFASTALAQAVGETPKDKAKQAEVSATTKAAVDSAATTKQAEEATKLKAQKGTPKALTTKQEKQAAAAAATKAGSEGGTSTMKDAAAANKDKMEKGTPRALTNKQEKQKAVSGTTEQAAKQGSN